MASALWPRGALPGSQPARTAHCPASWGRGGGGAARRPLPPPFGGAAGGGASATHSLAEAAAGAREPGARGPEIGGRVTTLPWGRKPASGLGIGVWGRLTALPGAGRTHRGRLRPAVLPPPRRRASTRGPASARRRSSCLVSIDGGRQADATSPEASMAAGTRALGGLRQRLRRLRTRARPQGRPWRPGGAAAVRRAPLRAAGSRPGSGARRFRALSKWLPKPRVLRYGSETSALLKELVAV